MPQECTYATKDVKKAPILMGEGGSSSLFSAFWSHYHELKTINFKIKTRSDKIDE
jgi:hypothetical protein